MDLLTDIEMIGWNKMCTTDGCSRRRRTLEARKEKCSSGPLLLGCNLFCNLQLGITESLRGRYGPA